LSGGVSGGKRKKDWFFIGGLVFLSFLLLFAIFGPAIRGAQLSAEAKRLDPTLRTYDPVMDRISAKTHEPPGPVALLGTDELQRDIVARLAQGARISLLVGFTVQIIAVVVGVAVGMAGVFAPKWIRGPLLRFTDGMFAFPDILLAILIVSIIGFTVNAVIVALAITAWPAIARLTVTQVATLKDREYVIAAKAAGAPTIYLIFKHILPQMTGVLMAYSMIELAGTILAESTLSFLGIGVQAPEATWGNMIGAARINMNSYPIELIWPCLILSLTIFSLNFVGDGIIARSDPKSR
jgi:ABC-type dipeptide/oligopeptide/nickel transport system permease subunit